MFYLVFIMINRKGLTSSLLMILKSSRAENTNKKHMSFAKWKKWYEQFAEKKGSTVKEHNIALFLVSLYKIKAAKRHRKKTKNKKEPIGVNNLWKSPFRLVKTLTLYLGTFRMMVLSFVRFLRYSEA